MVHHRTAKKRQRPVKPHGNTPEEPRSSGPSGGRPRKFNSAKGLVNAIFREKDPVELGATLLGCGNAATAAKIYTLLLEYRFGKPLQQLEAGGPDESRIVYQFVTHAPRPNYTGSAPDAVQNRGDGPAGDPTASSGDHRTEDEND
jgi:hypothetical protein